MSTTVDWPCLVDAGGKEQGRSKLCVCDMSLAAAAYMALATGIVINKTLEHRGVVNHQTGELEVSTTWPLWEISQFNRLHITMFLPKDAVREIVACWVDVP